MRDFRYYRSVNNAQPLYAFHAKGLIDDRPDTAGPNRVVERVCRPKNEVTQIRGAYRAGARIDLLSPPIGKGGRGTDFARQPGTLHEDIEIDRFGEVIWIDQSRGSGSLEASFTLPRLRGRIRQGTRT